MMGRLLLLLLMANATASVAAQTPERPAELSERPGTTASARALSLLLQPGMLSADFLSPPEGYPATSGFNLRCSVLLPTASRWWTPFLGASVTPYGTSGITPRSTNTPVLFAGNIFPLFTALRTAGWLDASAPLYLTYSYGGGGNRNRAIYGRDIVGEVTLQLYVGEKLLRDLGPTFGRLRLYLMFNQLLTPNEDRTSGITDRFNPVALYGLTLPIGGSGAVR